MRPWQHTRLVLVTCVCLATLAAAAWGFNLAQSDRSAKVEARRMWNLTGVNVQRGQRITITASGKAAIDTDGGQASPNGSGRGDASEDAVLPGAPVHGLVCRIGTGRPFFVGRERSIEARSSGELACTMNEDPARASSYADNSGAWNIVIGIDETGESAERTIQSSSIEARRMWNLTGVNVQRGQRITITASGEAAIDTDGGQASPDGSGRGDASENAVLPGAPVHGLVCRIGSGRPFFIGRERTIEARSSGELACTMNEDPARASSYADNSGKWEIRVVIQ